MSIEETNWSDPRIGRIVDGLLSRTKKGATDWQPFTIGSRSMIARRSRTGRADGFSYSTENSTVVVGSVDGDGQSPLYIEILDSSGTSVESITVGRTRRVRNEEGFTVQEPAPPDEIALHDRVLELYIIARRTALKTDQVLDQLANDLGL
jgi:hypothetical protein